MEELSERQRDMIYKIVRLMALGGGGCFMERQRPENWREEKYTFYWNTVEDPEAFKVDNAVDLDTLHSLKSYLRTDTFMFDLRNPGHTLAATPDAWSIYRQMLEGELLEYLWRFKQKHSDYKSLPSIGPTDLSTSEESFQAAVSALTAKGYIMENHSVTHSAPIGFRRLYITEEGEKVFGKAVAIEEVHEAGRTPASMPIASQHIELPVVDWHFVHKDKLRQLVENDYDELQVMAEGKHLAAKSMIVLLGSLLEAVLLDFLQRRNRSARTAYYNIYKRGKNQKLPYSTRRAANISSATTPIRSQIDQALAGVPGYSEWKLAQMIEVAEEIGLLDHWAKIKAHNVRETRNLIHPLVAMYETPPSAKDVSTIVDLFESVIRQLSAKSDLSKRTSV
ncbi:MAG: hypothetical protein DLM69_06435 [Candidatus Chloroheliales bacterium]|nr:MAG: hypothetical protein DLM69_06435 [Chloroflexota bacterium]